MLVHNNNYVDMPFLVVLELLIRIRTCRIELKSKPNYGSRSAFLPEVHKYEISLGEKFFIIRKSLLHLNVIHGTPMLHTLYCLHHPSKVDIREWFSMI